MNKIHLAFVILISVCVLGCNKPPESAPNSEFVEAIKYYPLKVGNWWKYEEITTNSDGTIYKRNITVTIDSLHNGYYRFNTTDNDNRLLSYWYVYDRSNSIYFWNDRLLFSTAYIKDNDTVAYRISFTDSTDGKIITDRTYKGLRKTFTKYGELKTILREFKNETDKGSYKSELIQQEYYAENIGAAYKVNFETKYFESSKEAQKTEFILTDYHIEK
jgi:hypothetical protein